MSTSTRLLQSDEDLCLTEAELAFRGRHYTDGVGESSLNRVGRETANGNQVELLAAAELLKRSRVIAGAMKYVCITVFSSCFIH